MKRAPAVATFVAVLFAALPPAVSADAAAPEQSRLAEDFAAILDAAPITLELSGAYYANADAREAQRSFGFGLMSAELAGPLLDSWEMRLVPEARFDTDDRTAYEVRLDERGRQRPGLNIAEGWLAYARGPWTFTLGKQMFNWGTGDIYSPSDDLNARDTLDLPRSFKLGAPAVSGTYATEDVGITAVLIPWFTPDRQPEMDNRWSRSPRSVIEANAGPVLPLVADRLAALATRLGVSRLPRRLAEALARRLAAAAVRLGFVPELSVDGRDIPESTIDNMQFGTRVTSSKLVPGWDLSLTAFHGRKTNPVEELDLSFPTVTLTAHYPRFTEVGGGFSTVVGDFELHGEATWHVTHAEDQHDDYLTYVAGFRRSWDDVPFLDLDMFTLILEYVGEHVTRSVPAGSRFLQTAFDRGLTNSVLNRLVLTFDEDTALEFTGALNLDAGDGSLDIHVTHDLAEGATLQLGVQIFEGPEDSFFGDWDDNDRVYAVARFVF